MKINILDFFMATLQIAFIVLKICGEINWSWWVVLLPILFIVVIYIAARLFVWWADKYIKRRRIKTPWDQVVALNKHTMEKRIIYSTEVSVSNMMLEAEREIKLCGEEVKMVYLTGYILRCSQRKLLGIIPLPNKYTYKVFPHIYVSNKYTDTVSTAKPNVLSFESKKRLMEETRDLESWLRNKCKQYKQSKQEE